MKSTKVFMEGIEVFGGLLPPPGHRYVTVDGCGPRMINGAKCMGTGVTLWDDNLNPVQSWSFKHYSNDSTNILAEFLAIRDGLAICASLPPLDLLAHAQWVLWSDNQYAVDVFNEKYQRGVKIHLGAAKNECYKLKEDLRWRVSIQWLPSANNQHADIASRRVTEFPEGT